MNAAHNNKDQAISPNDAISALFDISEKVIQEWILCQVTALEIAPIPSSIKELFGDDVQFLKELTLHKASTHTHYNIKLVCKKLEDIDMVKRKTDVDVINTLPLEFGHILNAYNSSIQMVYNASLKNENLKQYDGLIDKLSVVLLQLDQESFVWKAQDDMKINDVLLLDVTPMNTTDIEKTIGVVKIESGSNVELSFNPNIDDGVPDDIFDSDSYEDADEDEDYYSDEDSDKNRKQN